MTEGEKLALENTPSEVETLRKELDYLKRKVQTPGGVLRAGAGVEIIGNLVSSTATAKGGTESSLGETVVVNAWKNGAVIPLTLAGVEGIPIGPFDV